MPEFFTILLKTIAVQFIGVFGIFFLLGFILSKIEQLTHKQYLSSVGWKGIFITAWLGSPIHEIGHIFFAKIFRHRITEISLFRPNKETGGLGHVSHTYNSYSMYQRLGNFFIGSAPMIFGSIILVALLHYLVPNSKEVFSVLNTSSVSISSSIESIFSSILILFEPSNLSSGVFWLFIYLSFCISAHLAPSRQDLINMKDGIVMLAFILVMVNTVAMLLGSDITAHILNIGKYLHIFVVVFIYALTISLLHLIFATILLLPFRRR